MTSLYQLPQDIGLSEISTKIILGNTQQLILDGLNLLPESLTIQRRDSVYSITFHRCKQALPTHLSRQPEIQNDYDPFILEGFPKLSSLIIQNSQFAHLVLRGLTKLEIFQTGYSDLFVLCLIDLPNIRSQCFHKDRIYHSLSFINLAELLEVDLKEMETLPTHLTFLQTPKLSSVIPSKLFLPRYATSYDKTQQQEQQ